MNLFHRASVAIGAVLAAALMVPPPAAPQGAPGLGEEEKVFEAVLHKLNQEWRAPVAHAEPCPDSCPACRGALDVAFKRLADFDPSRYSCDGLPALMALRTLAFLAEGSSPDSGTYRIQIQASLDYARKTLLKNDHHRMDGWNLPFWAFVHLELLQRGKEGAAQQERLGTLKDIAAAMGRMQNPDGGWMHNPETIYRGYPGKEGGLTFTTAWNLAALGRMREAGVPAPAEAVRKGLDFMTRCTCEDGYVPYGTLRLPCPTPQRSAGLMYALMSIGEGGSPLYAKARGYVGGHLAQAFEPGHAVEIWKMALLFYAAGTFTSDEALRKDFYGEMRNVAVHYLDWTRDGKGLKKELGLRQTEPGGFLMSTYYIQDVGIDPIFGPAVAAIVLELPRGNLRCFPKGGRKP